MLLFVVGYCGGDDVWSICCILCLLLFGFADLVCRLWLSYLVWLYRCVLVIVIMLVSEFVDVDYLIVYCGFGLIWLLLDGFCALGFEFFWLDLQFVFVWICYLLFNSLWLLLVLGFIWNYLFLLDLNVVYYCVCCGELFGLLT